MFICDECGTASDDSLGFCRKCGSTKGRHVDDEVGQDKMRVDTQYGSVFIDETVARKVPIAMMLAFLPGLFDIFGLGQLYLKKWGHAALFIGLTALVIAVRFGGLLPMLVPHMWLITLGLFILQLVDMYFVVAKMIQ